MSTLGLSACFNYFCHREQSISFCDRALTRLFPLLLSVGRGVDFVKTNGGPGPLFSPSRGIQVVISQLSVSICRPFLSPCCGMRMSKGSAGCSGALSCAAYCFYPSLKGIRSAHETFIKDTSCVNG